LPSFPASTARRAASIASNELVEGGLIERDAAVILGISHQRVSQLVRGASERVAGAR
jgi:plasmid maintenance system antidote protein VapI